MSDDDFTNLQIHRDKLTREHIPAPTLIPNIDLQSSSHLSINLSFTYNTDQGIKRHALPHNTDRIEIQQAITNTEIISTDAIFYSIIKTTHSNIALNYERDQAFKWATFRARYLNHRGEGGPWSETRTVGINL